MTGCSEKPVYWNEEHRIDAHDVDYLGLLRPSVMLRFIQDAAGHAHHALGLSLETLRAQNKAYILSKVSMKLYNAPTAYEHVRAQTWITQVKGFSFNRYGQIFKGETVIGEMSSVWALTDISDPQNRRLIRGDSVELPFGTGEPLDLGFPPRLRIPQELELVTLGHHRVSYADSDQNRHMNNTVYPDLFRGFADVPDGVRVSEFEISYLSEAPMGQELSVLGGKDGDTYYFRSFRPDGKINAECRMVFVQV
jgi:acyl-CoA thioesterase FadM